MPKRASAIGLFLLVAAAAAGPIRSYDFFWHLATGRWVVEHRALPLYDPFALAGAHIPWINGEWLWQIVAYCAETLTGLRGVSLLNAIGVGALFATAFWFAARHSDLGVALLLAAVGFAGASDRLGVRPAAAAALFVVVSLALLASSLTPMRMAAAYGVLTVLWINTHPSALLAPILAAAALILDVRRWMVALVSVVALLINPFGWHAVAAPIELTTLLRSGEFVNAEWLPSAPSIFPLLYVTAVAAAIAFVVAAKTRASLWRLAVLLLLAALAIQHVRNQGLYFAALPLLFTPIPALKRNHTVALSAAALIPILWVFVHADHVLGVDDARFPVRAVAKLAKAKLPGNIYNADQFGGYLEWTFYPQRRVLTDGRNELFRDFIEQDARARQDSRVWHAILQQYRIDVAVDEYQHEKMTVIDVASGEHRSLPASLVRYRRRDWALIAFDDAAMVFARRAAFPAPVIAALEYRYLVPDDPLIGYINAAVRAGARAEVARAKREFGDLAVVRELERGAD